MTVGGDIFFGTVTVEDALKTALANNTLTNDLISEICNNIAHGSMPTDNCVVLAIVTADYLELDTDAFNAVCDDLAQDVSDYVMGALVVKEGIVSLDFSGDDEY